MLTSCLLAAFSNEDQMQNAAFTGMIESIHNENAIIAIEEGEILSPSDKVSVNLAVKKKKYSRLVTEWLLSMTGL